MALSFKDVQGNNIPFNNRDTISLDEQTDVATGEITAYLVEYNDGVYEVDEQTYEALKKYEH